MRSLPIIALLLAACATPTGSAVPDCDADWRDVESVIVSPVDAPVQVVPIECMRRIAQNRVRIGFDMPPGPTCYTLAAADVVESADAVSITLSIAPVDDPTAGACPEGGTRSATEIDLQAPVAERQLLDGSGS